MIVLLAPLILVPNVVDADPGPTDWMIVKLDSEGTVGWYTSIKIDSSDEAYISYYDETNGNLKYATNCGIGEAELTPWNWYTVDDSTDDVGWCTSIAIDSYKNLHISYYDFTNSDLKYATISDLDDQPVITIETLDSSYDVGECTSIAIDSNDAVHISYYNNSNGDLKYATNSGGSWNFVTIDSVGNVGSSTSIAVDSNDHVHISYYDHTNGNLKYATNSGGSWNNVAVDVDGMVGSHSSLAIDSNDAVHISYYDYTNGDLKHATNSGGSWSNETVDFEGTVGSHSSLAIDSNDAMHIGYHDTTNGDLKYATNVQGGWDTEVVYSSGTVGWYNSIALDSNDRVYISFSDMTNLDLKYAIKAPGDVSIETVNVAEDVVGPRSSIAVDSENNAHISYHDFDNGHLMYATRSGGSWVCETVDSNFNVGTDSALAIDSNDNAHISYYDATNDDLKYATNSGGIWSYETIDSGGDVGSQSCIAVDSDGNAHISYYDATNTDLKYATNSGGSWTNSTPGFDPDFDVGMYNSLALDSNDAVHFCYMDYTNGDLLYAKPFTGGWSISRIDSTDAVGSYCSMAIDDDDYVHISYYDQTNSDLKYALIVDGFWSTYTVDNGEVVGHYTSIGVDSEGRAHIAYHDSYPNYDLRYTTNAQGGWSSMTLDDLGMVGYEPSLAVDSDNRMHISYYDSDNSDLKYLMMYIKPSVPLDITWMIGDSTVHLSWSPPAIDAGIPVNGYYVYRGLNEIMNDTNLEIYWTVGLNYTDDELINGQAYYYRIAAFNVFGEGASSDVIMAIPGTSPSEPRSLQAVPGDSQVQLIWEPPLDDGGATVQFYHVYRGIEETSINYLTTVVETDFLDETVTNGQIYYYQVSAENWNNDGPRSEIVTATPGAIPSVPLSLAPVAGNASVQLFWEAPLSDGGSPIQGYSIYKGVEENELAFLTSVTVPEFIDTSVINGQLYYYRVTAFNMFGEGPPSETVTATPGTTPSAPMMLTAMIGDSLVELSWSPPIDDGGFPIEEYNIYRGLEEISLEYIATVMTTNFDDTSVTYGQQYFYQVTALNIRGEGPGSAITGIKPVTFPSAPEGLQAEAGDSYVLLTWIAPSSDGGLEIEGYRVYRGESESSLDFLLSIEDLHFNDTSVMNGQIYYYQVMAFNSFGWSPMSNMVEAMPQAGTVHNVPSAPLNLEAYGGNSQILLTWEPPEDNGGRIITNYFIYRGTTSGEESDLAIIGNILEYLDTSVENGVTYYYLVNAINAIGEGPLSNEASATPIEITPPSAPTIMDFDVGDSYVHLTWSEPESDGGSPIEGYRIYRGESQISLGFMTIVEALHFNDTSVVNGITFFYQVKAFNEMGEGEGSNIIDATPVTVPSAPEGLQAESGDSYVLLTWMAPYDGGSFIESFNVYRGINESSAAFQIQVQDLQFNDTSVINGITYFYHVTAVNSVGEGPMSNIVDALPQAGLVPSIPSAPVGLQTDGGISEILLTWEPPENNGGALITHYNIYRGTSSGSENLLSTIENALEYIDVSVVHGVIYYYQVSAVNTVGEGPLSNEASGTLSTMTVPSTPQNVTASPGNKWITLTWSAPEEDGGSSIINYRIYRATSSGSEVLLATIGNVLTYTDTGLTNEVTYYYKISAMNEVGNGPLSDEVFATPSVPIVPSTVQDLKAEAGDSYVLVTWAAPSYDGDSPITGYNVYRGTSSDTLSLLISLGTMLEYNDTSVENGITYYYQVTAINAIGEGPISVTVNATPQAVIVPTVPTAPQDPQTSSGEGYVLVTWAAPSDDGGSDIISYNVYRGTETTNLSLLTSVPGAQISYNDTSVENGQTYYYEITGVNDQGESPRSIMVDGTPESGEEGDNTMLIILGAIAVLAVIVIMIFVLRRK
jgi:fibronectin type 3 domain-containing protein